MPKSPETTSAYNRSRRLRGRRGRDHSRCTTPVNDFPPPQVEAFARPFPPPPLLRTEKQFVPSVSDLMQSTPLHARQPGSGGVRRTGVRLIKRGAFVNATIIAS